MKKEKNFKAIVECQMAFNVGKEDTDDLFAENSDFKEIASEIINDCLKNNTTEIELLDFEELNKNLSIIATKKDAFEAGYLVSSGINRDGGFYAEIYKRPYSEANGAYFIHATGGETEEEALLEAFEWVESGDREIENIHKQQGRL